MLDSKDIGVLRGMFQENNTLLRREIANRVDARLEDLRRDIRDEVRAVVEAGNRRVVTEIGDILDGD